MPQCMLPSPRRKYGLVSSPPRNFALDQEMQVCFQRNMMLRVIPFVGFAVVAPWSPLCINNEMKSKIGILCLQKAGDPSCLSPRGSMWVAQAVRMEQVDVPGCRGGAHPAGASRETTTALKSWTQQVGEANEGKAGGELVLLQFVISAGSDGWTVSLENGMVIFFFSCSNWLESLGGREGKSLTCSGCCT